MQRMLQQDFLWLVILFIVPAILGLDCSEKHADVECQEARRIVGEAWSSTPRIGLIAAINKDSSVITEECAIPNFAASKSMICRKIAETTSSNWWKNTRHYSWKNHI